MYIVKQCLIILLANRLKTVSYTRDRIYDNVNEPVSLSSILCYILLSRVLVTPVIPHRLPTVHESSFCHLFVPSFVI